MSLYTVELPLKGDEASEKWEGRKEGRNKRWLPKCGLKVAVALIAGISVVCIAVTAVMFFHYANGYMDDGAKATETKLRKQLFQDLNSMFIRERNRTSVRLVQMGQEYEKKMFAIIDNHTLEERNRTAALLLQLDQDFDEKLHKAIAVHTSDERNLTDNKLLELKQNLIDLINEHMAEEQKVMASKLSELRQDLEEPLTQIKTRLRNSDQRQSTLEQGSDQLRNQLHDLQGRMQIVEARKPTVLNTGVHAYNSGRCSCPAQRVVLLAVCVSTIHYLF